jgi:DedD protein
MDKALKQRLVGASVLIAFAVVVLPMLLSGQQGDQQESRRIDLPPKPPEMSIETRRFPIGEQSAEQPSVLEQPPAAPVIQQADPDPVQSGPGHVETVQLARPDEEPDALDPGTSPPPAETPTEAPAEAPGSSNTPTNTSEPQATPAGNRYLVQVASFSSSANANRLAGRLQDSELPVVMDMVDAQAGRLHRVRVGPYSSREEANAAIASLNSQMPDLNPRLLDLRPDEAAPVVDPSDPMVRWVVQAGVFGEQANAENLVFRLRDAGYRASSVAVTGSNGVVHKVRIGPLIERQDAVQISESIKRDLDIDGMVMSAD